jgi:hypothetical protein
MRAFLWRTIARTLAVRAMFAPSDVNPVQARGAAPTRRSRSSNGRCRRRMRRRWGESGCNHRPHLRPLLYRQVGPGLRHHGQPGWGGRYPRGVAGYTSMPLSQSPIADEFVYAGQKGANRHGQGPRGEPDRRRVGERSASPGGRPDQRAQAGSPRASSWRCGRAGASCGPTQSGRAARCSRSVSRGRPYRWVTPQLRAR